MNHILSDIEKYKKRNFSNNWDRSFWTLSKLISTKYPIVQLAFL
jgi:hypothetical protein